MIDIEKMITNKYPKLKKNKIINGAISKFADSIVHQEEIKIIANDFLSEFKPLEPILLNINNFQARQKKEAIAQVYEALQNDMALIIFPSGEVSRASAQGIRDKKWYKGFLKFANRSSAPILPVFIGGQNSKTFYSVSAINKKLSALLLSNEMFKQKNVSTK